MQLDVQRNVRRFATNQTLSGRPDGRTDDGLATPLFSHARTGREGQPVAAVFLRQWKIWHGPFFLSSFPFVSFPARSLARSLART